MATLVVDNGVYLSGDSVVFETEISERTPHVGYVLADPTNGLKITVDNLDDGTRKLTGQAMTNDGTGLYSYKWQIPTATTTGKHIGRIDIDGANFDGIREILFHIEAPQISAPT